MALGFKQEIATYIPTRLLLRICGLRFSKKVYCHVDGIFQRLVCLETICAVGPAS